MLWEGTTHKHKIIITVYNHSDCFESYFNHVIEGTNCISGVQLPKRKGKKS